MFLGTTFMGLISVMADSNLKVLETKEKSLFHSHTTIGQVLVVNHGDTDWLEDLDEL